MMRSPVACYILLCLVLLTMGEKLRILYYTRHFGTMEDFRYFLRRAIHAEPEYKNPMDFYALTGLYVEMARIVVAQHRANFTSMLETYDVIVLCDTIADTLPFLLLKQEKPSFHAKLVLQVVNRFDFGLEWRRIGEYHAFMPSTLTIPEVYWMVNNPFEIRYMAARHFFLPASTPVIRPYGFSDIPVQSVPTNAQETCVYTIRTPFDATVLTNTVRSPHLQSVTSHYGGPHTLAKYKCYVQFPYQVSVMKMYENLAAGVVTLIPSLSFLSEILRIHPTSLNDLREAMAIDPREYIEYYHPKYYSCFITFNSWDELETILDLPAAQFNAKYNITSLVTDMKAVAMHSRDEQFEKMVSFMRDTVHTPGF